MYKNPLDSLFNPSKYDSKWYIGGEPIYTNDPNNMKFPYKAYIPKSMHDYSKDVNNNSSDSSDSSDSSSLSSSSEEVCSKKNDKTTNKKPTKNEPIENTTKKEPKQNIKSTKNTPKTKTKTKKENIIINNYVIKNNTQQNQVVQSTPITKKFTLEELKQYKVEGLKKLCVENNIIVKKGAIRTDYETVLIKL